MTPVETELLNAVTNESAWLHGLARNLARDPERAADAAQRTLLAALERRPEARGSLRAWLATVLRRALREERRGEQRRADREALCDASPRAPTPEQTLARLELQERVVAAIRELDEPYRSTLVQRFLDGRSVREIARRDGVPAKSVHTRVERGLARLRARLDREHGGDRSAWLGALVALRLDPWGPVATGVGAMQAGTKALVTAGVLVALVGATAWVLVREGAPVEPEHVAVLPAESDAPTVPHEREGPSSESEHSARSSGLAHEVQAAPEETPLLVQGRVVDADGAPIQGARVRYVDEQGEPMAIEPTVSDAHGEFTLPMPERWSYLSAERDGYAMLARPYVQSSLPEDALTIVLVPAEAVLGIVVDDAGVPVNGARVRIDLPDSAFHAGTGGGWVFGRPLFEARSDALAGFRIAAVPLVAGARISAAFEGYLPVARELDELDRGAVELVLRGTRAEAATILGVVLDARGAPVEGALVSAGREAARTDAQGRFALELSAESVTAELCAVLPGAMPARQSIAREADGFPTVTLILGEEPLSISGRVLDEHGEPLVGAIVKLVDPTPFGQVEGEHSGLRYTLTRTVEDLATPKDVREMTYTRLFGSEFHLDGLLPRSYHLVALDLQTLASVGPVEIQAGSKDVELRLVGVGARRLVAGRVVTRRGEPLAGVGVRIGRHIGELKLGDQGRPEVETDLEGRFALAPFHVRDAYLVLSGQQFTGTLLIELDELQDLEALELVAGLVCRVRVRCTEAGFADELVFLDGTGEPLSTSFEEPLALMMGERMSLFGGESASLLVDDRATHLVLYRDGEEVYRTPVELTPGAEIELRVP